MDNQYRLFLKSDRNPDSALEWRFTKRDLDFLAHQYGQGVVDRQENKTLSLVLGQLIEHQAKTLHSMFTDSISFEALGRAFHGDPGEIPFAFTCHRGRSIPESKGKVVISSDDGDLLFHLQAEKHGVWNDRNQTIKVPFSLIEDVHSMFETRHPGLQSEWHRSKVYPLLMTPNLNHLQTYDVTLVTTVTMESEISVQARSAEVAAQKAVGDRKNILFHQVGTSPVQVSSLNLRKVSTP